MSRGKLTSFIRFRSGVTLIELMVVVACVGVLLAITLPALLMVRESARRTQCSTNLHQIGVAIANCHQRLGGLPNNDLGPFQEMASDLELPTYISRDFGKVIRSTSSVLKCPSDYGALHYDDGFDVSVNYFVNSGSAIQPRNGAVSIGYGTRLSFRDFTDGLSSTVVFSEHPRMQLHCHSCPPTTVWWNELRPFWPGQEREMRQHLTKAWKNRAFEKLPNFSFGGTTVGSGFLLDHLWLPNMPPVNTDEGYGSTVSPSSFHSGGVYVLFADGSVHFVTNEVAEDVWVAIGSRNGHEVVNVSFD